MSKSIHTWYRRSALLCAVASAALPVATASAMPVPSAFTRTQIGSSFVENGMLSVSRTSANSSSGQSTRGQLGNGNDVFASATATDNYVTATSVDITGLGTAEAVATVSESVTNNTAGSRDYIFTFEIEGGFLSINDFGGNGFTTFDEARASLSASVLLGDGTETPAEVWGLDVAIELADGAYSVSDENSIASGDSGLLEDFDSAFFTPGLLDPSSGLEVFWSDTVFTVDLGTLAVGETLELEYILSVEGFSNLSSPCFLFEEVTEDGSACYEVDAFAGDPGFITGISSTPSLLAPAPVPAPPTAVTEPESLALLGLGLAGLGLTRRRRIVL